MARRRLDYDRLAPGYDARYAARSYGGIADALSELARTSHVRSALEVGCGTGHWLDVLAPVVPHLCGVDISAAMLAGARRACPVVDLVRSRAEALPLMSGAFDLVFCVHAIHHFDSVQQFLTEAQRVLAPCGGVAVIGFDPRAPGTRWGLYDFFDGTYEADLQRYPESGQLETALRTAGFVRVERRIAEQIVTSSRGQEILDDPILQRTGTSQLALLSDEAYAAGRARLEHAIRNGDETGHPLQLEAHLVLAMHVGYCA